MSEKEIMILVGGAVVLYLLYQNNVGLSPAQIALNTQALNTQNTLATTQVIANAANVFSQDLTNVAAAW